MRELKQFECIVNRRCLAGLLNSYLKAQRDYIAYQGNDKEHLKLLSRWKNVKRRELYKYLKDNGVEMKSLPGIRKEKKE